MKLKKLRALREKLSLTHMRSVEYRLNCQDATLARSRGLYGGGTTAAATHWLLENHLWNRVSNLTWHAVDVVSRW